MMRLIERFILWLVKIFRRRIWQKKVDEKVRHILDEAGEFIAIELGNRKMRAMWEAYQKAGGPKIPIDTIVTVEGNYSLADIVIRLPVPRGALFDAAVREFTKRGVARRYLNGDLRVEANGMFTAKDEGKTITVEMLELEDAKT